MVSHGRVELLSHQLSHKYLQMKWNAYGKYIHLAQLILYILYLAILTSFASNIVDANETYEKEHEHNHPEVESRILNASALPLHKITVNILQQFVRKF